MVALLLLSHGCLVTVNVLWLFLTVPWIGLRYVIVVFPDHPHFLFDIRCRKKTRNPKRNYFTNKIEEFNNT